MFTKRLILWGVIIVCIGAGALAVAQQSAEEAALPEYQGTYKFVSRTLSDGTKISAPDVAGLLTLTDNHRNFNVMWKLPDDKVFSYSIVSTFEVGDGEYTETLTYSVQVDESKSPTPVYNLSGESKTVPYELKEGKLSMDLPFDPVRVTMDGKSLLATGPDFTDRWEKID